MRTCRCSECRTRSTITRRPKEAAQTAARAGLDTLILTHYVPPIPLGGTEDDWRALAAQFFAGTIELGDDLHRVDIHPST